MIVSECDDRKQLIQRFNLLLVHNVDEQELLEDLPVSLTYEIAKPSSESKILFIYLEWLLLKLLLKHHRIHYESPKYILGVLGIQLVRTSQKQFWSYLYIKNIILQVQTINEDRAGQLAGQTGRKAPFFTDVYT